MTYLSGFIQRLLPNVLDRMKGVFRSAVKAAGWGNNPDHLGIRCVETLVYHEGGRLVYHTDADSVYTVPLLEVFIVIHPFGPLTTMMSFRLW